MAVKKIPMRTCVVTRDKYPKKELIRIVRTPLGEVVIDLSGKLNGRGAYIKYDLATIEKAKLSKVLDRSLEVKVPDSVYESLIEGLEK